MKKIPLLVILLILTARLVWPGSIQMPQSALAQADDPEYTYYFPFFTKTSPPLPSTSYYMITVDPHFTYNLGCDLGERDRTTPGIQDSVAVLDFSYPVCNTDGSFGADIFFDEAAYPSQVGEAARAFAEGYYACSDSVSQLVVGVGTNNKPNSCETAEKMAAHGAAWAEMVNEINTWLLSNHMLHQVQAFGANDMEIGWNSPEMSRSWLSGYQAVAEAPIIFFGDAAGCPYEDRPYLDCGASAFPEWTSDDLWYVSWGSGVSWPLPLIYLTSGIHAQQWAYLSQYSVNQHGLRMDIKGVFTQYQACEQWEGACNGTDNTPEEAYTQLYTELNKVPATAQTLRWATDIRWLLASEISGLAGSAADPDHSTEQSTGLMPEISFLQSELSNPDLSEPAQSSLSAKLDLLLSLESLIEISRQSPAPKLGRAGAPLPHQEELVFRNGLQTSGDIAGLPYGATLNNIWQQATETGYLQVGAGAAPQDPTQGALYIQLTDLNLKAVTSRMLLAEEGSGALRIIAENGPELILHSEFEDSYTFNWETWTFSTDPQ